MLEYPEDYFLDHYLEWKKCHIGGASDSTEVGTAPAQDETLAAAEDCPLASIAWNPGDELVGRGCNAETDVPLGPSYRGV